MHILIIGAAGMVGRKLTEKLVADGHLGGKEISRFTLADVVAPDAPKGFTGPVDALTIDLSAPEASQTLIANRPDVIFHLAAIVSGEAEADFDKGYRINFDGTRYLFDTIRLEGGFEARLVGDVGDDGEMLRRRAKGGEDIVRHRIAVEKDDPGAGPGE
ncbi:MAG: NAD-dependent epimerase/dehydratase family protein, partial [Rhizobiales bacterium]|nr:NAD-dependent epimerase/dehydratase family protein [Hyphomicrobiales bacterium]